MITSFTGEPSFQPDGGRLRQNQGTAVGLDGGQSYYGSMAEAMSMRWMSSSTVMRQLGSDS